MLFTAVFAHFTLSGSREQAAYPGSNVRFWPISGGDIARPSKNCLDLPEVDPIDISGVYSATFEIGEGAAHIGLCKAFLINKRTGEQKEVAVQDNCVSTGSKLDIDLSHEVCVSCVLRITVAADHLVTSIEEYDSCVDVHVHGLDMAPGDAPQEQISAPSNTLDPSSMADKVDPVGVIVSSSATPTPTLTIAIEDEASPLTTEIARAMPTHPTEYRHSEYSDIKDVHYKVDRYRHNHQ